MVYERGFIDRQRYLGTTRRRDVGIGTTQKRSSRRQRRRW